MTNIMNEAHKVEGFVSRAQHGDNSAATALSAEFVKMSVTERNTIALIVEADFSVKHGVLSGGGKVELDPNGNVTGINFNQPVINFREWLKDHPVQPSQQPRSNYTEQGLFTKCKNDFDAAEHGSAGAQQDMKKALLDTGRDNPAVLNKVLNRIQREIPNATVTRDATGAVSSIEVSPTLYDRAIHGAHSVEVTLAPITDHSNKPGFTDEIRDAYDRIPGNLTAILKQNHFRIDAYNDVVNSGLVPGNVRPGNYAAGLTFHDDPAFTSGNEVVMANFAATDGRTAQVVFHEAGHALDNDLGMPSNSAAFKAAYEKDMKTLTPQERAALDYYLPNKDNKNNEDVGRSEMFAQIMDVLNHVTGPDDDDNTLIARKFAKTIAVENSILRLARPHS